MVCLYGAHCCSLTSHWLSTPSSRATPSILKQSPRFGVKSSSIILSSSCKYSRIFCPGGASAGSSIKPSALSASPNSFSEHSIPNDSTPRNFAGLILKSPGNTAPTLASGIIRPGRTFVAPQTICNVSLPSVT